MVLILAFSGCASDSTRGGKGNITIGSVSVDQSDNPKNISESRFTYNKTITSIDKNGNPVTETIQQTTELKLGSTWENAAKKLAAMFDSLRPLMILSLLMIPIGLGVWYYMSKKGWPINAALIGGGISLSGIAMFLLCVFAPQINPIWGLLGLTGIILAVFIYFGYYKGKGDSVAETLTKTNDSGTEKGSS